MKKLTGMIVMVVAAMVSSNAEADRDISETRKVSEDAFISVINAVGEVRVATWSSNEVRIEGRLGDSVKDFLIEETGSGLRIEVKNPKMSFRTDGTLLDLTVPAGASLEVESVSADVEVAGLEGERLLLGTVSGDQRVEVKSRIVEMQSVSGDMRYEGGSVRTVAESVSGDIEITGVSGELKIGTVSGDVDVSAGELSDVRFETVSGEIDLDASLAGDARLTVESMSGDVNLRLPAEVSARFEISSFSGDISTEFRDGDNGFRGNSVEFSRGGGSARVRLESFSGDINIDKK